MSEPHTPITLDNPVSVALANREILYARRCLLVLRECSDTGQFAGFCLVSLITIVSKYAVWYYLYLYSMTHQPAKGGLVFLLPHFAVSMCGAAVCTQEMPHAERIHPHQQD